MDIKSEIKRSREALGLTRNALSVRLGLDNTYIRKVEAGEIDPALATLRKLGRFFRAQGQPFSDQLEQLLGLATALEPTG